MKKLAFLLFAALLAFSLPSEAQTTRLHSDGLVAVAAASAQQASQTPHPARAAIVGTWVNTRSKTESYVFYNDGEGVFNAGVYVSLDFTWKLSGNVVKVTFSDGARTSLSYGKDGRLAEKSTLMNTTYYFVKKK